MKKIIVLLVLISSLNLSAFSQQESSGAKLIGFWTKESSSFTLSLNNEQKSQIFSLLKELYEYNGNFSDASIDDPEPANTESVPYFFIDGKDTIAGTTFGGYFRLTKVIYDTKVEYYISAENASLEQAGGTCTGVNCTKCKKERSWFLGPVTGCDCQRKVGLIGYCNHGTGGGPTWVQILVFIVSLL